MRQLIIGIFVTIILWQYIGIVGDDFGLQWYRPTDAIDSLTEISRSFFNWLGGFWAHLCSFWHQINIWDFVASIYQIFRSLFFLLASWTKFPYYYLEIRNEFAGDRFLIDAGAITIIAGLIILIYKSKIKSFNRIGSNLVKGVLIQSSVTMFLLVGTSCKIDQGLVSAIECLQNV